MVYSLQVADETTFGHKTQSRTLEFLEEHVTAREVLRRRIYEEVQEHNLQQEPVFQGLIQPSVTETLLNGVKVRQKRTINWELQYREAQQAFETGGFIMLVNDLQIESLEEEVHLKLGQPTEVTFLKLVPLVGG